MLSTNNLRPFGIAYVKGRATRILYNGEGALKLPSRKLKSSRRANGGRSTENPQTNPSRKQRLALPNGFSSTFALRVFGDIRTKRTSVYISFTVRVRDRLNNREKYSGKK